MRLGLAVCGFLVGFGFAEALRASTIAVVPVDPRASFLVLSPADSAADPPFVSLAALGLVAGDVIELTAEGYECFYRGPVCEHYSPSIGGIFSSSATLLDPSNQNRVAGAIAAGLPAITSPLFNEFYSGRSTSTPDDFAISSKGVEVLIPEGAEFLFAGVFDSYYADNTGNLAVLIELVKDPPADVPELSTLELVGMGAGFLFALLKLASLAK